MYMSAMFRISKETQTPQKQLDAHQGICPLTSLRAQPLCPSKRSLVTRLPLASRTFRTEVALWALLGLYLNVWSVGGRIWGGLRIASVN